MPINCSVDKALKLAFETKNSKSVILKDNRTWYL